MQDILLKINGLQTRIEEKQILMGLDLEIKKGEIHVLMGPNGAGKSTLAYTLMGHPKYEVTDGTMELDGESINDLKTDERAKKGLFLSFQYPEEIPGVTVENFLRTAKTAVSGTPQSLLPFHRLLIEKMKLLDMKPEYAGRYLNMGFSGGEKKKNEILQMAVLEPRVAILDETDSGLDVDAIRIVAEGVKQLANEENAILVITHYNKILEYLQPDYVHVLFEGRIVKSGGVELAHQIDAHGYDEIKKKFAAV